MKKLFQMTLAAISIALCGGAFADKSDKPAETVYNEDNTTIQVTKQNPTFTIKLKSNPTTGYTWFLREYSTKMLTPVKHNYEVPQTKLIGAPGYELWTFRVNQEAFIVPQMLTVRLIYARPWKSADAGTQVVFRVMTGK
jgi:inhibitor of cysteine peptidase